MISYLASWEKLQSNKINVLLFILIVFIEVSPVQYAHAEWVEFVNDASLEVIHNDNINSSAFAADEEPDTFIRPSYTFGRFYQASDLTRLRFTVDASARKHDKFDKLDSVDLSANVIAHHKFGVGFEKPWLRAKLSVGRRDADVAIRDSTLYEVGLATGRRFGERLSGQIGAQYNSRNGGSGVIAAPGKPSNVFDIENTSLTLGVGYLLSQRLQLSAAFTHRNGEFVSACTVGNVGNVLDREKDNVRAITLDDVFGGCVYRLDGNANAIKLQASYALGRHASLNLGYQKHKAKADVLDYDSALWNISFMYSR